MTIIKPNVNTSTYPLKSLINYLVILILAISILSCDDKAPLSVQDSTNYKYQIPPDLGDGIQVSDLHSEGLDSMPIKILIDSVDAGVNGVLHSLLIFRNDKLVLEEYFNGSSREELHPMYSATKSIASAVVGIAIRQGLISGVGETVYNLLSQFNNINWTDQHKQITLEHYLTMTAGYQWDESSTSFDDPANSHYQMIASGDNWIKFLLELPLKFPPGDRFHYNTGISTLFSVIVTDAVAQNFDEYAYDNLLSRIGIEDYSWYYMPGNYPATGGSFGGIHLKSRDLAKFGLLYLNNGIWNNEIVIDKTWIDQSLKGHINITQSGSFTYGYQWWINEQVADKDGIQMAIPYAVGHGGQHIFLIYKYDMMVVTTAPFDNPGKSTIKTFELIEDYILSAVK